MKKALLYLALLAGSAVSTAKTSPGTVFNNARQPRPAAFIENKGQIENNAVDFKFESAGVTVFIECGQLHYQWSKQSIHIPGSSIPSNEIYRMDMVLLGANQHAEFVKQEEQDYYERYYNPSEIVAKAYAKIICRNIYPNIDWVLYSKPGISAGLEYDFIVHPGGNVSDIRMQYDGAVSLNLENGSLNVKTPMGTLAERKPYSYLEETGKEIASSFKLDNNILSFAAATTRGTLVIDPIISWATYYGDAPTDAFYAITSDAAGDVYAAGLTRSLDNITTTGAHKTVLGGSQDAMLVKFNTAGQRLWATYYGGAGTGDVFRSLACDKAGNIYAAGQTNSNTGIHSTGAYDTTLNGLDAMLIKFNAVGQRIWGTYYGGTGTESSAYVACDENTGVFICGSTQSTGSIASDPNVHKPTYHGVGSNGFLAKFDSAGVRQWGTYYGRSTTAFTAISCDAAGNVYAGGSTTSVTDIHSAGAYDTTLDGTVTDAFIVKFNTAGIRQWGTYYGGGDVEDLRTITAVKNGSLYIGGYTRSDTGIATTGSYQDTIATTAGSDGYLAKFSTDAGMLKWATYYGGTSNDYINAIALNAKDKLFVVGQTSSVSAMSTTGSYQEIYGGGTSDGFFLIFDTSGYRHSATYYGGVQGDIASGVTVTPGNVYFVGETNSASGIATVGSYQDTLSAIGLATSTDGFIAKFAEDQISLARPFPDSALCPGDFLQIGFTVAQNFSAGNVFNVELSDTAGSFLVPKVIGFTEGVTDGMITAQIPFDIKGGLAYRIRLKATNPAYISTDKITDIVIKQGPHKPDIITNAPFCEGYSLFLYAGGTIAGASYQWVGPDNFYYNNQSFTYSSTKLSDSGTFYVTASMNGCSARDTANVQIYAKARILNASSNTPICDGGKLELSATDAPVPGISYIWSGPNGFIDTSVNPTRNSVSLLSAGVYSVMVDTSDLKGCGMDTTNVVIVEIPIVTASNNGPLDEGEQLLLTATSNIPDLLYSWTGPDSFQSTFQNPEISKAKESAIGAYIVKVTLDGCDGYDTTIVIINKIAKSSFSMSPNPAFGDIKIAGTVLTEQSIPLAIVNAYGQVVYREEFATSNLSFSKTLKLTSLANGMYQMKLRIDGEIKVSEFILIQQ